jgi:hypothetical protein
VTSEASGTRADPYGLNGARPQQYGLFAAARVVEPAEDRWMRGGWIGGDVPGPAYTFDPCSTGTDRVKAAAGVISSPMSELDSFTFDKLRLERLNTKPVKGRSAVKHNRMPFDNFFKYIPNFGSLAFNHLFCALDGLYMASFDELANDKRLE